MNPLLIKSYRAGAAISPSKILKFGAADGQVIQATDGATPFNGVSVEGIDVPSGGQVDSIRAGLAYVKAGGAITRGAWLTSDANGDAVAANIVAGEAINVIGRAEQSAVDDDVFVIFVMPGLIATDTGIFSADITVSSAEMLALNATPKQLIAAPGAGFTIVVEDALVFLDYNSAAYAGVAAGEDLAIKYTDASGAIIAQVETDPFLTLTADALCHVRALTDAAKLPIANSPVVLHMLSGEVTTGNSPLKVRIRYRVVPIAW